MSPTIIPLTSAVTLRSIRVYSAVSEVWGDRRHRKLGEGRKRHAVGIYVGITCFFVGIFMEITCCSVGISVGIPWLSVEIPCLLFCGNSLLFCGDSSLCLLFYFLWGDLACFSVRICAGLPRFPVGICVGIPRSSGPRSRRRVFGPVFALLFESISGSCGAGRENSC